MTARKERIVFDFTPLCSTDAQYRSWLDMARLAPPGNAGFCEDCTDEYQAQMIKKHRCQHPEIIFDALGNGCLPQPDETPGIKP